MRQRYILAGLALASAAVVVACTLNPQPLPPGSDFAAGINNEAGADGGAFNPAPGKEDAGGSLSDDAAAPNDATDGGDAGDGGDDAGDAGDAATDAD